jgi:hypothetical protein
VLYMIIERFRNRDPVPVYRRFRDQGRMAPEGVTYVSSWVTLDIDRCYQVMECEDRPLGRPHRLRDRAGHHVGAGGRTDHAPVAWSSANPSLTHGGGPSQVGRMRGGRSSRGSSRPPCTRRRCYFFQ